MTTSTAETTNEHVEQTALDTLNTCLQRQLTSSQNGLASYAAATVAAAYALAVLRGQDVTAPVLTASAPVRVEARGIGVVRV